MGCRPGAVKWIELAFNDCIYGPRDLLGFSLGLASIVCWLFAQVPQLYKNYKTKSAEALSAWFLAEWLLGDTFNLVGSLLKGDQPQSVVLTAQYFVCMDVVLLVQYMYYSAWQHLRERQARRRQRRHRHHRHAPGAAGSSSQQQQQYEEGQQHLQQQHPEHASGGSPLAVGSSNSSSSARDVSFRPTRVLAPLAAAVVTLAQASRLQQQGQPSARRLLADGSSTGLGLGVTMPPWAHTAGTTLGYASCVLYLTSRLSQLYKNWRRQSVEGLAVSMFAFAIAANSLYGSSLLIRTYNLQQLTSSLPWLLGSLGTVALDLSILLQSRVYGEHKKHGSDEEESLLPVTADDD